MLWIHSRSRFRGKFQHQQLGRIFRSQARVRRPNAGGAALRDEGRAKRHRSSTADRPPISPHDPSKTQPIRLHSLEFGGWTIRADASAAALASSEASSARILRERVVQLIVDFEGLECTRMVLHN